MKLDNLVIEELSRMKSLFGYERGKVVSEQESGTPVIDFNKLPQKIDNFWNSTNELVAAGFPNSVSFNDPNFLKYYDRGYSNNTGNYFWTKKKTAPTQNNVGQVNKTVTKTEKTPSTPPCSLPPELKDAEGVKSFQDWLDTNKAGWATGYKEGILKQGANGGGYGKFGPRTCKAWKYKNEYLNKSTEVKTGYEEYGGVSGDNKPAGNVNQTQTGNAGQAPTGNAGQPPTGNAGQPPTGDVNQSSLEQMPMRDADYFNGYQ